MSDRVLNMPLEHVFSNRDLTKWWQTCQAEFVFFYLFSSDWYEVDQGKDGGEFYKVHR